MARVDHCLEWALIWGLQFPDSPAVWGTENMNDLEILLYLKAHQEGLKPSAVYKLTHSELKGGSPLIGVKIERKQECIICKVPSPCLYRQDRASVWRTLFRGGR